jgi:hypothetical protein
VQPAEQPLADGPVCAVVVQCAGDDLGALDLGEQDLGLGFSVVERAELTGRGAVGENPGQPALVRQGEVGDGIPDPRRTAAREWPSCKLSTLLPGASGSTPHASASMFTSASPVRSWRLWRTSSTKKMPVPDARYGRWGPHWSRLAEREASLPKGPKRSHRSAGAAATPGLATRPHRSVKQAVRP